MNRARRVASWGAAGLALATIAWLRLDGSTRGTVWAEDGRIFLAGALDGTSVFAPYEGYAHVVPRMLAELTVWFVPVADYGVAMTALSLAVAAVIGLLVFGVTAHLDVSRGARAALAGLTVLAPALITEVSGNAANLHWLFLWLAPWLLLARPTTWIRAALLGVVAFLAASTEIQLVLFLPLLLVDVRNRRRWPVAAGAVIGAIVQGVAFVSSDRQGPADHPSVLSALHGYALQVAGGSWLSPISPLTDQVVQRGWWIAYAVLVPFVLAAAWLLVRGHHLRVLVVALVIGSVVSWSAGYLLNLGSWGNFAGSTPEQIRMIGTLRHAVTPSLFLLAVAVLAADRLMRTDVGRPHLRRGAGLVLAGALIVSTAMSVDGHGDSLRSAGPEWRTAIAEARSICERTAAVAVRVQTAPPGDLWSVRLSCRRLSSER